MRAAVFHNQGDVRIEDVPIPEPTAGEVLIEVEWCGQCASVHTRYVSFPYVEGKQTLT